MNILVVFTGGTIGSVEDDSWISVNSDTKYKLIENYKKQYSDNETVFEYTSPYYILSENLSAKELNMLYNCIEENLLKGYDGIIVTHGTDTLQYTSSAIGLLFPDIKIPVVFVSSAYPLENPLENGSDNFAAAVGFIKSKTSNGVFISYKNENENKVNIHTATRLKAHSEASADVFSIDNNPYACFENGGICCNHKYIQGVINAGLDFKRFCDYSKILMLESIPGNDYNYHVEEYNAVILAPYHSATLDAENSKFADFCEKARKNNIPVFLVNAPSGARYESVKTLDSMNIISLPFCSKISVYMKCWIALSAGLNVKEYVLKAVAQEFIEKN